MPFCHNDTSKKYTRNEKSPLGLGYTASVEPINKILIGKDNDYYIVKYREINDFFHKILYFMLVQFKSNQIKTAF